jgi:plastocyanin
MRFPSLAIGFLVVTSWGCSGGGSSAPSMPTPTSSTPSSNAITVNIMGQNGAQSFNPNPAPITQGSLVAWRNMDTTVHRIVMNDGSFDSGDIGPGGTSVTMRLSSAGGNYHCTIHPTTMFGSINVATDPLSSPGSPY